MRGKANCNRIYIIITGITPAYAGKSDVDCKTISGEAGSPPPMRGKATHLNSVAFDIGITPAYAGKRSLSVYLGYIN